MTNTRRFSRSRACRCVAFAALVASASFVLTLAGCSGGDGPPRRDTVDMAEVDAAPIGYMMKCGVRTTPAVMGYFVDTTAGDAKGNGIGDVLTLENVGGMSTADRVGARPARASGEQGAALPILGAWRSRAFAAVSDGVAYVATVAFTETAITLTLDCTSRYATIRATTSSPIALDDGTITILEEHEQLREWTRVYGDRVLRSLSGPIGLGGGDDRGPERTGEEPVFLHLP